MKRLRDLLDKVEPQGTLRSVRAIGNLLQLPIPLSVQHLLKHAEQFSRIIVAPLTVMQQNMALFPPAVRVVVNGIELLSAELYKGTERAKILPALMDTLRLERPDIVGLSEMWQEEDKHALSAALKDLYPYVLGGPNGRANTLKIETIPTPISYAQFDGGLMLLSRHPIVASHETIYRQCKGEDCFTKKGALHARVRVEQHTMEYDIFLTHMQSCPPEAVEFIDLKPGDSCVEKLRVYQTAHLAAFVQAYSSPRRPTLLLGDLNQDGLDPDVHAKLVQALFWPDDLWLKSGNGGKGITSDRQKAFTSAQAPRPADDPARHKEGSRLDYCFSWPGIFQPLYTDTRVHVLQSTPGARDLSDHYGLTSHQSCLRQAAIDTSQPINKITVILGGFRCLTETSGPLGDFADQFGSDEVEFVLRVWTGSGASSEQRTPRVEGVDSGTPNQFASPIRWASGDPGDALEIEVQGFEVDPVDVPFIGEVGTTDTTSLGRERIRLERDELLRIKGHGATRIPPLLTGNDGEYAVYVTITVE